MKLALALIEENGGTQSRAALNLDKIKEYSEILERLPPIIVFYDGTKYWLGDGFHRVAAAANVEAKEIDVDVRQGTLRDAILFSFGANASHGIPRSSDDKRQAIVRMLADGEWGAWSDVKIAEACRVGRHLVAKVRAELEPASHLDDRAGENAHLDDRAGERLRKYVTKHGTEAVMNIGPPPPPDRRLAALVRVERAVDELHAAIQEGRAVPGFDSLVVSQLDDHAGWLGRTRRSFAA